MAIDYEQLLQVSKSLVQDRLAHINLVHKDGPKGKAWLEFSSSDDLFIEFLKQKGIGTTIANAYVINSDNFGETDNAFASKDICEIVREVCHHAGIEAITRMHVES